MCTTAFSSYLTHVHHVVRSITKITRSNAIECVPPLKWFSKDLVGSGLVSTRKCTISVRTRIRVVAYSSQYKFGWFCSAKNCIVQWQVTLKGSKLGNQNKFALMSRNMNWLACILIKKKLCETTLYMRCTSHSCGALNLTICAFVENGFNKINKNNTKYATTIPQFDFPISAVGLLLGNESHAKQTMK